MSKNCPIMLASDDIWGDCYKEKCAWYDKAHKCCCVMSIADRLWDVSAELKELTDATSSKS